MKILHVITSLKTGGAEHLLVDLLPQLRKLGNDVELLVFDGAQTPFYRQMADNGIKIHHLSIGGNVYNPLHIFRIIKYLSRYDIIHTHNTACQLFVPIAKSLSLKQTKLVTTEHSANNRRRGKWYLKFLDKWMYSKYKSIICISEQPAVNLRKHIGNINSIIVINNGVNISNYLHPIKDVSLQPRFMITQVSSFNDAKDQDTLIKAIALLPGCYRLKLVGDGYRRPAMMSLAKELNIDERIEFTGIRTNISELLQQSDINVLSSHWEGLSLSSIEGMASGRPFVASDVDGLREVVDGYGILFKHGDEKELAQKITELCENTQYYKKIAMHCQERAKQFDISLTAEKYNQLYQQL